MKKISINIYNKQIKTTAKNRYFKIIHVQVPNISIIVKKCVSMIDKASYHTGVTPDNNWNMHACYTYYKHYVYDHQNSNLIIFRTG